MNVAQIRGNSRLWLTLASMSAFLDSNHRWHQELVDAGYQHQFEVKQLKNLLYNGIAAFIAYGHHALAPHSKPPGSGLRPDESNELAGWEEGLVKHVNSIVNLLPSLHDKNQNSHEWQPFIKAFGDVLTCYKYVNIGKIQHPVEMKTLRAKHSMIEMFLSSVSDCMRRHQTLSLEIETCLQGIALSVYFGYRATSQAQATLDLKNRSSKSQVDRYAQTEDGVIKGGQIPLAVRLFGEPLRCCTAGRHRKDLEHLAPVGRDNPVYGFAVAMNKLHRLCVVRRCILSLILLKMLLQWRWHQQGVLASGISAFSTYMKKVGRSHPSANIDEILERTVGPCLEICLLITEYAQHTELTKVTASVEPRFLGPIDAFCDLAGDLGQTLAFLHHLPICPWNDCHGTLLQQVPDILSIMADDDTSGKRLHDIRTGLKKLAEQIYHALLTTPEAARIRYRLQRKNFTDRVEHYKATPVHLRVQHFTENIEDALVKAVAEVQLCLAPERIYSANEVVKHLETLHGLCERMAWSASAPNLPQTCVRSGPPGTAHIPA